MCTDFQTMLAASVFAGKRELRDELKPSARLARQEIHPLLPDIAASLRRLPKERQAGSFGFIL